MKKIVPALYSSYGRYIDEFRAIPNINDCLKPVERRTLYSLHKTAQKLTKSAKVVGDIIGMYHPHGDACLHTHKVWLHGNSSHHSSAKMQEEYLHHLPDVPQTLTSPRRFFSIPLIPYPNPHPF